MRKRFWQRFRWHFLAILSLLVLGIVARPIATLIPLVLGYKAKEVAAFVFVANQSEETAIALVEEDDPSLRLVTVTVDYERKQVHASLFGVVKRTATFDPSFGTVLVLPENEPLKPKPSANRAPLSGTTNTIPTHPTPEPLNQALVRAFAEPSPVVSASNIARDERRTRAILVFQNDHLIAERYADGFSATTRFCGWSMTKSVMGLLAMMRVDEGALELTSKPKHASWRSIKNDPRNKITLAHFMQMTSGLAFTEDYSPTCDAVAMLYGQSDMARYALDKPLVAPEAVGRLWQYSSGSANIVSRMFRNSFQGHLSDHLNYPKERLFHPLGMTSALFEIDGSGTFVGSSFLFATARDWLQVGRLVLNKGYWNGQQLISEHALTFLFSKPEKSFPQHRYGALWWLNVPYSEASSDRWMTGVPADALIASGHFGQALVIIPSQNLVIVRLGLSKGATWSLEAFLPSLLAALPPSVSSADTINLQKSKLDKRP